MLVKRQAWPKVRIIFQGDSGFSDGGCSHGMSDIRRQIRNYKRFKKLSGEWIALDIEHSRLAMKLACRQ